jgi:hypothetical protein
MKKAVTFVILAMVVIGYCSAQSENDAQRIVGTWTQENGTVWVFNENGTGAKGNVNFYYGISSGGNIYITGVTKFVTILYMSPDGRRMLIGGDALMLQKK